MICLVQITNSIECCSENSPKILNRDCIVTNKKLVNKLAEDIILTLESQEYASIRDTMNKYPKENFKISIKKEYYKEIVSKN